MANRPGTPGNDTLRGTTNSDIMNSNNSLGDDTMFGLGGNDLYLVNSIGDSVKEDPNAGIDTVQSSISYILPANVENLILTGTSAINGTGNALANTLIGNTANNILDGGAGNDTYIVDSAGDVIKELAGGGTDSVKSSVTYTLGAEVENLQLSGAAAINATGNALANTLTGNNANNILDGGAGADVMTGGNGNDTYYVDNIGDTVTENTGGNGNRGGIDTVYSSINYTLGVNVENLVLTGTAANGTGNALANSLTGNAANNILDGGAGNDTLLGGAGNDTLIGGTGINKLQGGLGQDVYTLSNTATDTIVIPKGDSMVQLTGIIGSRTPINFDKITGFSSNDKLDLQGTGGVMGNATVDTVLDTTHFKSYNITNGLLTLKNAAGATVPISTLALVKEAFLYLGLNLGTATVDKAVALNVSYSPTTNPGPHTLVLEHHGGGVYDTTAVDIVGTLTQLTNSQII